MRLNGEAENAADGRRCPMTWRPATKRPRNGQDIAFQTETVIGIGQFRMRYGSPWLYWGHYIRWDQVCLWMPETLRQRAAREAGKSGAK